jgi:hypothetical protein
MSCAGKDTTRSQTASQLGSAYKHGAPSGARRLLEAALNRRKSLLKQLETGVINQGIEIQKVF